MILVLMVYLRYFDGYLYVYFEKLRFFFFWVLFISGVFIVMRNIFLFSLIFKMSMIFNMCFERFICCLISFVILFDNEDFFVW